MGVHKSSPSFADCFDEKSGNIERLKKLRMEYFTANGNRKKEIESEFAIIQKNMMDQIIEWRSKDDKHTYELSNWQPFNYAQSPWFDPEWMFGIKDGFDIVIGNPPYIRQERLKSKKEVLQKQGFEVYNSTSDIYTYFYEKGWQILKDGGYLTFITSNKWMRAKYGEKLRKFLKDKTSIIDIIDFGGHKVFESATVDTNILLFKKTTPSNYNVLSYANIKDDIKDNDLYAYIKENRGSILQSKLDANTWTLAGKETLNIKEKIESIGIPLKDWDVNIYRGVITGFNEAFIISTEKRNEILANCETEEEMKRTEKIIKPILRGRDINRYSYKWAGMWIISIKSGWTTKSLKDNKLKSDDPGNFFKNTYPAIYNHLIFFVNKKGKGKGLLNRDDHGDFWWELRDCDYYDEFEKEKIVWQEIVREPNFSYDNLDFYVEATGFLMIGENLKYLLAIFNSKPATFFFKNFYTGGNLGIKGYRYKKAFLKQLPIPQISEADYKPFIDLVDKILDITKDDNHLQDPYKSDKIREYEQQIDEMVYKLYNLTEEEINLIEHNNKSSIEI